MPVTARITPIKANNSKLLRASQYILDEIASDIQDELIEIVASAQAEYGRVPEGPNYHRTYTLQKSWHFSIIRAHGGITGYIYNNAIKQSPSGFTSPKNGKFYVRKKVDPRPYAHFVQGTLTQSDNNAAAGWRTIGEIILDQNVRSRLVAKARAHLAGI